jgi:RNA polymerase sigma-70 factor (ECF subfamily)
MSNSSFPISLLASTHTAASDFTPRQAHTQLRQSDAVSRAQVGDEDAFSELYAKNKKHVFSICLRMVRDFSLAEDLTQDTFLQVHRKLASFRGDAVFSTWLHRLAVNTVLMHLRKRALAVVSLDHLMESVPEERAGRSFGTRDLTQAGVIDRLAIEGAIETMAPGYRIVFLLHDIHGFDHGEIASMLECTCGNTKSQLHKARRAMRGALTAAVPAVNRGSASHGRDIFLVQPHTGKRTKSTMKRASRASRVQSAASALAT